MSDDIQETPGATPNFRTELAAQLAELVPEAIADGKIDVTKLKELLAEDTADDTERFGLFWPGKKRALRAAQEPTSATLRPDKANSKDWDTTQNVFIEGDNLEVLKILQKHYHNKIKLIYIDPPYNTGKDFVYPDNFKEGLDTYLEWTRQVNEEGKKVSTNSESEGRYHSNWLNMMYPRLKLARNLLTDDGVIFISIDDNEFDNLRKICNEVFGENNFITTFAVENNPKGRKNNAFVAVGFEYCLVFARRKESIYQRLSAEDRKKFFTGIPTGDGDARRTLTDEYGSFKQSKRQVSGNNKSNALASASKQDRCFTIYFKKDGETESMVLLDEYERSSDTWFLSLEGKNLLASGYTRYVCTNNVTGKPSIPLYSKETLTKLFENHGLYFKEDGTIYEKERTDDQQITSFLPNKRFGLDLMTESATSKMESLFGIKGVFTNSKSVDFIKTLVRLIPDTDFTVVDLFAGSATTAHAVMQQNVEDGGTRRFIAMQLPEPVPEESEASKANFPTIADIARERIRLSIKSIVEVNGLLGSDIDTGFRSFKLGDSNFSKWRASSGDDLNSLEQRLLSLRESASDEATSDDLLTEILLKQGYSLTEKISESQIAGLDVRIVGDNLVIAYLTEAVKPTLDQVRAIVDQAPARIIMLEDAFRGDDELKTNLAQLCRSKGIELWTA